MMLSEIIAIRNPKIAIARNNQAVKLVRHKKRNCALYQLYEEGELETYQRYMTMPTFHSTAYVISFIGIHGSLAKFVGIYKVGKFIKSDQKGFSKPLLGRSQLLNELCAKTKFLYHLHRIGGRPGLADLRDRLVIDWGPSAIQWCQRFHRQDKEVWEIQPRKSPAAHPFQGYYNVCLTYRELKSIVRNRGNREWHDALSEVAGIYLILDTQSGRQYIGSAYGRRGVLGRWQSYARNPHGNNEQLKRLLLRHPGRENKFQFSLLKTLEKDLPPIEVIGYEHFYKRKLGSKAFGLNGN
jgi:hypothetical protein